MKAVKVSVAGLLSLGLLAPGALVARERVIVPMGWHIGTVRIEGTRSSAARPEGPRTRIAPARTVSNADRQLTINRAFRSPSYVDRSDPLEFGAPRYGDIRSFSPFPVVTSGTQLPYGLDGIGGFGSDIGFSAGSDAAIYDRGS